MRFTAAESVSDPGALVAGYARHFSKIGGRLILGDAATLREGWLGVIESLLARATLARPADGWMQSGGRTGRHTEHLGHLLSEMQHLQRTYPGATW